MNIENISGILATYKITIRDKSYFDVHYQSEKAKSGEFIPMLSEKNQQREADHILKGFTLKKGLIAAVFGIVSIPLLQKLNAQREVNGGTIFVFEADPILASFYYKKLNSIFNHIWIITSTNLNTLNSILDNLDVSSIIGYRIFRLSTSIKIAPEFYQLSEQNLKKELSIRFSDLLTRLEFQKTWILNSLEQIPLLNRAIPVKNLFGSGIHKTAVLVSTGPSLRKSLGFLKENKNKFFIACVDSALRVLYFSGIIPHLVITLDSQAFTIRHFEGVFWGRKKDFPILYADLVANPQVTNRWKGPLFLGVTAQYLHDRRIITPGCEFIEESFRKDDSLKNSSVLGDIQSGGSVSTSLFDLLRRMEFKNIILVGQDLAYTNREIHCTGTYHTINWLFKNTSRLESLENINEKVLKKRHIQYQASIRGKKIPADHVLSMYRDWFEESISKISNHVYNATYDGLPIRSTLDYVHDLLVEQGVMPFDHWGVSTKTIGDIKKIKKILHLIKNTSFSKEIEKKYLFLNQIGKKYEIKLQRKNKNVSSAGILQKKTEEQRRFWKALQKKAEHWLKLSF